jgi:hypothetical protein
MMKAIRAYALLTLFSCILPSLTAQHTVGLISYDLSKTYEGYNLMFPHNQPNVYLLNNCGEIVHFWDDEPMVRPGNTVYLLPNGDLVKCSRDAVVTDDVIWAGGGGEFIEIRDWDNNLKWKYTLNDSLQRLHHDIAPMPNGNILAIVWERKLKDEAIAAGRDSTKLGRGDFWSEAIYEIQPEGDSFNIVWEWHQWDHMIQDFDSTKANFGVLKDNPGLINMNWGSNAPPSSWMHMNAIDFNPFLNQILVSTPAFSEIWIIDHSTTTAEAAGHTGGLSNRGGDLMFRWGNPAVYGRGDASDEKLFFQHDPHWVDAHLDPSHPQFGKIVVYNNRVGSDSSSVNILNPLFLEYAWMYAMDEDSTFLPADFDWSYGRPDKEKMFSGGLSSVQLLPNGNTLICAGQIGNAFEITGSEEIVWEYRTPLRQGNAVAQGEMLVPGENQTFRMNRYPADYPAFAGRDLSGKGYIELNPDTAFCDLTSSADPGLDNAQILSVYPNPVSGLLTITWNGDQVVDIQLMDELGHIVIADKHVPGNVQMDLSGLTPGLYLLRVGAYPLKKVVVFR